MTKAESRKPKAEARTKVRDDELLRALRGSWFQYIDLELAVVLYRVGAGNGWVYVIGHPEDASYEWVQIDTWTGKGVVRYSDAGYGGAAVALRDGLLVAEGPPDVDPESNSRAPGESRRIP